MTAQDKKNPAQVREQSRVRSSVGSEPSGSYSYHDESRMDSVRGTARSPANDTQPAGAGERVAKGTMVGGFADPLMAERAAEMLASATSSTRKPLSEPPEIGSWPPLPNVPNELARQSDDSLPPEQEPQLGALPGGPWTDEDEDLAPTDPPKRTRTGVSGGAIWEAVAPVVGQYGELERVQDSEPPLAPAEPTVSTARASEREHASLASPQGDKPRANSGEKLQPVEGSASGVADRMGERMSTTELDYRDRDVAKFENLVERGAWEQLAQEIGNTPAQDSPTVALLQVIAKRELLPANEKGSSKLNQEAIQALALLLGVPPSSPLALLLAKRLLRRNPVWIAKQPATGLSVGIVLAGLAAGIGIGWLVTKMML